MAKAVINRRKAAKEFAEFWKNKGDEKQHTQAFWLSLLRDVFGISRPEKYIDFEKRVKVNGTKYIDAYIAQTNVAIEQKSEKINLDKKEVQSDKSGLTPYEQAKRYNDNLRYSERCRWIVVSNFSEIRIYDMERDEPEKHFETVLVENLDKDFERLQFLVDQRNADISREEEISLKAGELVGKLYDAILKQYKDPESDETLKSLNILCVRFVFLLYAEDAGIFAGKDMFGRYLAKFRPEEVRKNLMELFVVLNTKPEERDPYLNDDLAAFPYVNGGLFAERNIEIPRFNDEIVDILVNKASAGFDWSKISPTIFGAVFESTLNPETRRKGGMHYTSIQNIHKVIDPLFLDDLRAEFTKIVETFPETSHKARTTATVKETYQVTSLRKRNAKLEDFRNKLAALTFLDPACGSGNFLTETYISLRRLENECLKFVHGSQMLLSSDNFSPIKVKILQFYGIEINDFAVTVAKTALWIAESQMMKETEEIVERDLDFLPLSTSATIVEGNALRMDWRYLREETEIPTITAKRTNLIYPFMVREPEAKYRASDTFSGKKDGFEYDEINLITDEINVGKPQRKQAENHYDYIMGNPPFVGFTFMSVEQKKDLDSIFFGVKNLDYVCCWYKKAADFIQGKRTRCAFVSTNSITQGETVARFFPFLNKVQYDFAWRTFRWDSESTQKAHVHCVIIGFSSHSGPHIQPNLHNGGRKDGLPSRDEVKKRIYLEKDKFIEAGNINPYLIDAPDIIVASRNKPLCNVPQMVYGNKPADGGCLIIEEDEYEDFIRKDPESVKFVRPILGAAEFLHGKKRWCLWLVNATPAEIKKSPLVYDRVKKCQAARKSSIAAGIRKFADIPHLFAQCTQPEGVDYIIVPRVSSENRKYIPIGFEKAETIVSDAVQIVPKANLYHFGILTSRVHNAWMRAVCGRLEMRYRYSKDVVYNNFPWPGMEAEIPSSQESNSEVKNFAALIEETAHAILDARAKYPDSSLADLYDDTLMPPELRKAHKENDKAVMAAYGFNPKITEAEIVAELFKIYEKLTK